MGYLALLDVLNLIRGISRIAIYITTISSND